METKMQTLLGNINQALVDATKKGELSGISHALPNGTIELQGKIFCALMTDGNKVWIGDSDHGVVVGIIDPYSPESAEEEAENFMAAEEHVKAHPARAYEVLRDWGDGCHEDRLHEIFDRLDVATA